MTVLERILEDSESSLSENNEVLSASILERQ